MATIRRKLFPGEVLFRQDEPADCAWLIESGAIQLQSLRDGRAHTQGVLGPGELIGELGLLDSTRRDATATAQAQTALLMIDADQFAERIDASDPIIRAMVDGLRQRMRALLDVVPPSTTLPLEDQPCNDPQERIGIDKIRLEAQLREALADASLAVHYQPIYDIAQARVTSYEALLRWQHPQRGMVSPAEFIQLAEETSLIVPIGEYVLDRVCEVLVALRDAGTDPLPCIAVNLSARQLVQPGMAHLVIDRIQRVGLPSSGLKLEVTESRMLDYAPVTAVMRQCREHGIAFALDDFGTGFSNLTHLHVLDFEFVKLDQAFARHMFDSPRAMTIVEAIVAMAHGIGAEVIAEGVETREQLLRLQQIGVQHAQGYLIGKAQTAAAVLSGDAARLSSEMVVT